MTTITGDSIQLFHMYSQLKALELELKGLKFSRGSVYAHIKRTYGLRGSRKSVRDQFEKLIKEKENECIRSARH